MIQYLCGKFFGYHHFTTITTKTLEGYWGGLFLTELIFINSGWDFMKLNMIGMLGGLFSSYLKRSLGIKHWSNLLGPHGGVGDRLDSLIFPIIYYFYKY
jgi:phosphatidate cytidylyltransferase